MEVCDWCNNHLAALGRHHSIASIKQEYNFQYSVTELFSKRLKKNL